MDTTATAAPRATVTLAQATPMPTATCGPCPCPCPPTAIDGTDTDTDTSTRGSSRVVLLLCLRALAAFVWAASRSTLQRMLLAYLQSAVVAPTWRSFLASAAPRFRVAAAALRAVPAVPVHDDGDGGPLHAHRVRGTGTGAVAHRVANSNAKRVSWSYLRGAYHSTCTFYYFFGSSRSSYSCLLNRGLPRLERTLPRW
jgi:hypothetical protein